MNRLLVALLAAFDAVIAAAIGVAAALAPLTIVWAFGFGGTARWTGLWPTSVRVWQAGHLVPVQVTLPAEYVNETGIAPDAASFAFSLAPLAFAVFTALFAARSAMRAARSGAWLTGVVSGTVSFAVLAALMAATSGNPVATVVWWQAILLPAVVFGLPALIGAVVAAWRHGDDGVIDRLRRRWGRNAGWRDVPAAAFRGAGAALAALIGIGALLVVVGLVGRGGEVVAVFEAAHVDLLGVVMLAVGQLAYLPTLVVWAAAFVAGPGFAVGVGTTVAPAGTHLGVVPGIPVLGILPAGGSAGMLLFALLVVGAGVAGGGAARARLAATAPAGVRFATAVAIALLSGVAAAVLGLVASGGIGPGRLGVVGPDAGAFALAVALEVVVGAAVLLLSPVRTDARTDAGGTAADRSSTASGGAPQSSADDTSPADDRSAAGLPGRPAPLPGGERD